MPDPGKQFTGSVFRAHNPEWAWDPLSGEGARVHGGRFNRIGQPALYTAMTELGAIREASPLGRPMQPLTLCQYDVNCRGLFDSTNVAELRKKRISTDDLACPNWRQEMLSGRLPDSQRVADRLISLGYSGLIVKSFARDSRPEDINIVFWHWSDSLPNKVVVIDRDDRLPRDRSSWH